MNHLARAAALLIVLGAAGCGSSDKGSDDDGAPVGPQKLTVNVGGRPTQTLELDDFNIEWDDIDVDDTGEKSAFQVAQWVKQRYDAAVRCLRADPPDYAQATKLLGRIASKVPSSSKARKLLAEVLFSAAAYWWRTADAIAWEMERIGLEGTAKPNGPRLTDADMKELLTQYQPYRDNANEQAREHAQKSLKQFELYRQLRPDDKLVFDFVWKLHFFLQDYRQSIRWLDYVLREMDVAEVPEEEPLRQDYLAIRKSMVAYLAEQAVASDGEVRRGRGIFPFGGNERGRGRLQEDFTPGR
jgi:hypothetical protein